MMRFPCGSRWTEERLARRVVLTGVVTSSGDAPLALQPCVAVPITPSRTGAGNGGFSARAIVADISDSEVVVAILAHLGLPPFAPPIARARSPGFDVT